MDKWNIENLDNSQGLSVTPENIYLNRKKFMKAAALFTAGAITGFPEVIHAESVTDQKAAFHYNNFYEFTTDKEDVAELATNFRTDNWKVRIEGLVNKPVTLTMNDFRKNFKVKQRVYRFRCVEGWSMVLPWMGIELGDIIRNAGVKKQARYVEFETVYDPSQMPGQNWPTLKWPYREGLRMDEAMHPLTLIAIGLYNRPLPNQNGAPLRLVVPWKYGFKSIKSIVAIRFTKDRPDTTWNLASPTEYGFYANVNPDVPHPRWSQATERRVGEIFRISTRKFNGYEKEVANLYSGMDLHKYF